MQSVLLPLSYYAMPLQYNPTEQVFSFQSNANNFSALS